MLKSLCAVAPLILALASPAAAKTWVVDQKNEEGSDFTAITSAIASAANGDTIEVRPGVYEEELALDKKIVKLVALQGPTKTTVTWPDTILTISQPGAAGTLIQGFRFTAASHGAVRITNAIVTFEGNVFEGNGSKDDPILGGAVWLAAGSQVTLTDNLFTDNHASEGGAVHVEASNLLVRGSRFVANGADTGGAIYADAATLEVERAFFCDNVTLGQGGALAASNSTLSVQGSVLAGNEAALGGGLWLDSVGAPEGGAVPVVNATITGNSGGGVALSGTTSVALKNVLLHGHTGGGVVLGGAGSLTVTYSMVASNEPAAVVDADGAALPDPEGQGLLLTGSPDLVSADDAACEPGAFEPAPDSALVDAGDPAVKDPDNSRSDIGAYGGPGGIEPVIDSDGDTVVDLRDNCPEDSNVDQKDTDADGEGDKCDATSGVTDDKDKDGVKDVVDNCPNNYNPEQVDTDGDQLGDVCDANDDGDPVPDIGDCKPLDPNMYPGADEVCNSLDDDCDGIVDEGVSCQEPVADAGSGGADAGTSGGDASSEADAGTEAQPAGGDDGGCNAGGGAGGAASALALAALLVARRRKLVVTTAR